MIRLIDLEVENFRSITEISLFISFDNLTVIVGPNNCGKSNIIRALQLFFNGKIDGESYFPDIDYPKNTKLSPRIQTKITVTVSYSSHETNITRAIDDLEDETNQERLEGSLLKLRLSYSKKGVESWQFIGKGGTRNIKKGNCTPLKNKI